MRELHGRNLEAFSRVLALSGLIILFFSFPGRAEPSEIFLEVLIPSKYAQLNPGESVLIQSDIILREDQAKAVVTDVLIEYSVKDSSEAILAKVLETKGGILRLSTVRELELPSSAKAGMYTVEVSAQYQNITGKNSAQFEIVNLPPAAFFSWQNYSHYSKIGAVIILATTFSLFLFGFWRLQGLAKKIEGKNEEKNKDAIPYPNYAVREYGKVGLVPLAGAETSSLVEKMTEYIHTFNYHQAVAHHYALQSHLEFSLKEGSKLRQAERLQKKLHLLLKINQLSACAGNHDLLNLKYHLNEAATLYAQLLPGSTEEEHFLEKVKSAHDTFAKMVLDEKRK